jgi:UPF0716 protein FxsA
MLLRLSALFVSVALIELFLILQLYRHTGLVATLSLVFGTGLLGAYLARREGLRTLAEIRRQLSQGLVPADPLLDGALILLAGALLLAPGVVTDITGLLVLLPGVRAAIRRRIRRRILDAIAGGTARAYVRRGP